MPTVVRRVNINITESFTLEPSGTLLTVDSGTYPAGTYVSITESAKPTAYGYIAYQQDSTHVFFVPLQSDSDGANIFSTNYTTAADLNDEPTPHVTLSIDLTEAPDGEYNYIIVGAANITAGTSSGISRVMTLSKCLPGDPWSTDGLHCVSLHHYTHGSYDSGRENLEEIYQYNSCHSVTLEAGSVYEFHIAIEGSGPSTGDLKVSNGRLLAFRVNTIIEQDNSTDSTGVTSTGSWTSTGINEVTATVTGPHLVVFSAHLNNSSVATGTAQVRLRIGSTDYCTCDHTVKHQNDYYSDAGIFYLSSLSSGSTVQLQVNNGGGGANTATMAYTYLAIIPLDQQGGYGFDYDSGGIFQDQTLSDVTGGVSLDWEYTVNSSSHTLLPRRYVEIIGGDARKDVATDKRIHARPVFRDSLEVGTASRGQMAHNTRQHCLWFARTNGYIGGDAQNSIDARTTTNDSTNAVKVKNSVFLWLPEYEDLAPSDTTPTTIIADVESGLWYRNWSPHGYTDVFRRDVPDISRVSRVIRNSHQMTELSELPSDSGEWNATAEDSWYFDPSIRRIYVKMPSGKQPGDDDQTVVVIALDTYGRKSEILIDDDNETFLSYKPLLKSVPKITQELKVRSSDVDFSANYGNLSLIGIDGRFDSAPFNRIYEGLRVIVRRGYSELSNKISTFEVLSNSVMGYPKLNESNLTVGMYDTGATLKKPVSERLITVYNGDNPTEGQELPFYYGSVKRVPAYRVTNNTSNGSQVNTFKICAHQLNSIGNVYANGNTNIALTIPNKYERGAFFTGPAEPSESWNADVLYVDIVGLTDTGAYDGTALKKPGEIAQNIFTIFPREANDTSEGIAQVNYNTGGGSNFTPSLSGNVVNGISGDLTKFQIGDTVKVVDGSSYFHAYIYAKGASSLSIFMALYDGDDNGHTYAKATSVINLVETRAGLESSMLDTESFRKVDRKWRKKMIDNVLVEGSTPTLGLVIDGSKSIIEVMKDLCKFTFTYWYVNRAGRVAMKVPDLDADNLVANSGFEVSGDHSYPWSVISSRDGTTAHGTGTLTTGKRFDGLRSLRVDNLTGSFTKNPHVILAQKLVIPKPGTYALTGLFALDSGIGSAVRIGIIPPGDGRAEIISEPFEIPSSRWTRITTYFNTGPGNAGTAILRVYPYYSGDHDTPPTFNGVNLKHWYVADDLNSGFDKPKDRSDVTTWYDRGTSAVNLTQSTESRKPHYITNYVNGRNAVGFDAIDDELTATSTITVPYTIFVVYALHSTYSGAFRRAFSGSGFLESLFIGADTAYTCRVTQSGTADIDGETITSNINTAKIHTVRVRNPGTAETQYWINGTSIGTQAKAPSLTSFTVGNNAAQLDGAVMEILIYDAGLSNTRRQSVEEYLAHRYGIQTVGLLCENIELVPVSAVLTDDNSVVLPVEFNDELFPEARVSYSVNTQKTDIAPVSIVSDSRTRNLSTSISEGKNALQTSQRLDFGLPLIEDGESADGIGAAAVAYHGRIRYFVDILTKADPYMIPHIGEKVLNYSTSRLTNPSTDYPILQITKASFNPDNAAEIQLEAEGQIDPLLDRAEIEGIELPIGSIVLTTSSGSITDFEEVEELRGYYLAAASVPDIVNEYGNLVHTHTMSHTHNLSNHRHSYSIVGIGNISVLFEFLEAMNFTGPLIDVATGYRNGGHTHTGTASGNTEYTSGASQAPTTTLNTLNGGNDPAYITVRFMRRYQNSGINLPTSIRLGYESSSVPPTWTRDTAFNGKYLRGATGEAAITGGGSLGITATYTPSESGSLLKCGTTGMFRGRRLVVTNGSNVRAVVVSYLDEANGGVYVYPLNEPGNSGSSFATSGTAVTAPDSDEVGTSVSAYSHDHIDTVPSHVHKAPHAHRAYPLFVSGGPSDTYNVTSGSVHVAGSDHTHQLEQFDTETDSSDSSAASGSTISSSTSAPDSYGLIWMYPDGYSTDVPSGAIILWEGSVAPRGYTRISAGDNLLLKGASGATTETSIGGHYHTFVAAAHTYSHNHGGSQEVDTGPAEPDELATLYTDSGLFPADEGHGHTASITIGSTSASLEQNSNAMTSTASGDSVKPIHKRLMLCRRD